eukprot:g25525.t1
MCWPARGRDVWIARLAGAPTLPSQILVYVKKGRKMVMKLSYRTMETLRWFGRKVLVLCKAFVKNPKIIIDWGEDLYDIAKHFIKWTVTGFKLLGADVRAAYFLTKRVFKGYPLSVRERRLLVRTLRKQWGGGEMADFWQQVVAQRTQELYESDEYADKAEELVAFQEKLTEGKEYPTLKEILRFASIFKDEMHLEKMSTQQLTALSQMLGLPTLENEAAAVAKWSEIPDQLDVLVTHGPPYGILDTVKRDIHAGCPELLKRVQQVAPQFHFFGHIHEDGRRRAIRFHGVTEEEMRESLNRWLRLSANHRQIPTSMLLWVQSFYLRDRTEDEHEHSTRTEDLKLKMKDELTSTGLVRCLLGLGDHHSDEREQETVENPEDAFLSLAERQKEAVDKMQQKLEELQREIVEVTEQHQDVLQVAPSNDATAADAPAPRWLSEACANCGHVMAADSADLDYDDPEGEKRRMLHRNGEDLDLYKQVVQKQRSLLDGQLRFLLAMRDTTPTQYKDADRLHKTLGFDRSSRMWQMMTVQKQAEKETQTQAEGRSPDLPPEHPLRHLDKSKENGEAWFNQSFDSDACLVMDDRSLFIHKAYVMEKSGFFERLFGDDMAGTSADYMLPLPKVLRYQYVMKIIQWMYTGDTQDHGITEQNCISMIREAKYFLMTDEFVMILCHVFVDAYKSEPAEGKEKLAMTLLDQASDTTLEELLTLLDDCGICKDLRLKILATWANKYSLSQSGDQQGLFPFGMIMMTYQARDDKSKRGHLAQLLEGTRCEARRYGEEARVMEMFAQLDIRGRGAIGAEDIQKVLSNSVQRKDAVSGLRRVASGKVSLHGERTNSLRQKQENSLRRFSDMVKEFDLNGDGYLDPFEFRKMLREELWSEGDG